MHQLTQHIEYLLRRHDCVILPGLGAFIASARPAYINEEWGFITPPSREIHFNPSINNNDGLLANSYSRKHKISFEAANAKILSLVSELKGILKSEGEFSVGRIGVLCNGEEDTVYFTPFRKKREDSMFFGLHPVKLPVCETEGNKEKEEGIFADKKGNCYYIPINKTFARIAAIFIVGIMALISVSFPPAGTSGESNLASIVPIPKQSAIANVSTKSAHIDTVYKETPETIPAKQEDDDSYFLIVASLPNEKEARKFIASHSQDNFTLECETTRSMSRVYAAKSADKATLYRMLNSAEFKAEFSEAWVWHKK